MVQSFIIIVLEYGDSMKQGFTLVELLAVIVILSLVALITVPVILKTISGSEDSADRRSAENYRNAAKTVIAQQILKETKFKPTECDVIETGEEKGNLICILSDGTQKTIYIKMEGTYPDSGKIRIRDGELYQTDLYYKDYHISIDEKGTSELEKNSNN